MATEYQGLEIDRVTGWRMAPRYALLVVVSVIVLFPVYTTVIASLKPGDKVLDNPLVPDSFTLDVLRNAWSAATSIATCSTAQSSPSW